MDERDYRRKLATAFYNTFSPGKLYEVDYIDFRYPVRDVRIERGTRLWGYKDPRVSPLMTTFFCIPGTPVEILGVHGSGALKTNPKALLKTLNEYEVLVTVPHALESVCADGLDSWSLPGQKHQVGGGGWQYKIPEARRFVRYTSPFPKR
jgi:hypothetical protein